MMSSTCKFLSKTINITAFLLLLFASVYVFYYVEQSMIFRVIFKVINRNTETEILAPIGTESLRLNTLSQEFSHSCNYTTT